MKYDVQILSLAFKTQISEEELVTLISSNISRGLDIVILPETCTGATKTPPHKLDEGFIKTIAGLALEYSTYILLPLFIQRDGKRYNTTLLYDRSGKLVFSYDKQYPFWAEYDLVPPVTPGKTITTYLADFGRIGLAICFDANFPLLWQKLADDNADIVFFISEYSAGQQLAAHALNHHYSIISTTLYPDCSVYDIAGQLEQYKTDDELCISRLSVNTNKIIMHENYNLDKVDRLLKDHGDIVELEKHYLREQWLVLKGKTNIDIKTLAKEYGLETLREYKRRSEKHADRIR